MDMGLNFQYFFEQITVWKGVTFTTAVFYFSAPIVIVGACWRTPAIADAVISRPLPFLRFPGSNVVYTFSVLLVLQNVLLSQHTKRHGC